MARIECCGRRQSQQLGLDADHLPPEVRLWHLTADAAGQDRVADERVVRDHEADAARRVPWGVQDLDLELAEVELVAVDQVAVRRAQELLGVGGVDPGLASGD